MNNEIPDSLCMEGTFDLTLPGYDDDRPGSVVYEGGNSDVRDMADKLENPILWEHEPNLVVSGTFIRRRKKLVVPNEIEETHEPIVTTPIDVCVMPTHNTKFKKRFKTAGMWVASCVFCVLFSRILNIMLS